MYVRCVHDSQVIRDSTGVVVVMQRASQVTVSALSRDVLYIKLLCPLCQGMYFTSSYCVRFVKGCTLHQVTVSALSRDVLYLIGASQAVKTIYLLIRR